MKFAILGFSLFLLQISASLAGECGEDIDSVNLYYTRKKRDRLSENIVVGLDYLGKPKIACHCDTDHVTELMSEKSRRSEIVRINKKKRRRVSRPHSGNRKELIYAPSCCKLDLSNPRKLYSYPFTLRLPEKKFTKELNDPKTEAYQKLRTQLASSFQKLLRAEGCVAAVDVTKFSQEGGVLADVSLSVKGLISQSIINKLRGAVESGIIGNFKVEVVPDVAGHVRETVPEQNDKPADAKVTRKSLKSTKNVKGSLKGKAKAASKGKKKHVVKNKAKRVVKGKLKSAVESLTAKHDKSKKRTKSERAKKGSLKGKEKAASKGKKKHVVKNNAKRVAKHHKSNKRTKSERTKKASAKQVVAQHPKTGRRVALHRDTQTPQSSVNPVAVIAKDGTPTNAPTGAPTEAQTGSTTPPGATSSGQSTAAPTANATETPGSNTTEAPVMTPVAPFDARPTVPYKPELSGKEFKVAFVMTEKSFEGHLNNPTTMQYQELKRVIEQSLTDIFRGNPSFLSVSVLSFRPAEYRTPNKTAGRRLYQRDDIPTLLGVEVTVEIKFRDARPNQLLQLENQLKLGTIASHAISATMAAVMIKDESTESACSPICYPTCCMPPPPPPCPKPCNSTICGPTCTSTCCSLTPKFFIH